MISIVNRPFEATHIRGVAGHPHALTDCSVEFCGRQSEQTLSPETQAFDAAPDGDPETYDLVGAIMAFEDGTLGPDEVVVLFSELIASGKAWVLQGSYSRSADALIRVGFISRSGSINWDVVDAWRDLEA